jgi:two-component system, cell cycle sensor histidine kinase and response regulator CckA
MEVSQRIEDYSRLLFEEATDGIFIASHEGIYLAVNRSGHRILGYSDGELIGKPTSSVVAVSELARLQVSRAALSAGNVLTELWTMRRKDGKTIDVEVRAQKLSDGSLLGIVRELGARDEYERKTQISEARLRSILQTAPDIILTIDRAGTIRFINRTLPQNTAEQILGRSCYDFVPQESRARVAQAIEHVFTTHQLDEYEVPQPPDEHGHRGWSSVRVGPLFEGDQVVAVTMCATDVSEYKREVARTQELLGRLNHIASLVPGMVFQFRRRADGSGCFPYSSEHITRLFGLSPEAVLEDADPIFSRVHPDDLDGVNQVLHVSATKSLPIHHEFRILQNNQVRWLSSDASVPDHRPDGSILWHGFLTDVTERRDAEQTRSKLEVQLIQAQKMESIGQLAGGVAHDFNNLLMVITGFVDLTLDELVANAEVRPYLDGIRSAAARGATLTQQLVAFARKKIIRPENVNLNSVLNQMAPMIRRLVGEHINVQLSLDEHLKSVKVDAGSMEQVLMNLVVNARDAMPHGGTLTLLTRLTSLDDLTHPTLPGTLQPGAYVVLSVSDTGTGISADVRSRLFEPFFTTKPKGAGTGLGLAMCHGIIRQASGIIDVRTEVGAGTSFDIYLPIQEGASLESHMAVAVESTAGNEVILVVEDEPMILRLITHTLEKVGYQVLTATDGIDALDVVSRTATTIDLLITDVVMPRLGGRELAQRLQQHFPNLTILFMSGYAENALAHQGELPPGLHFIQKPYHPAELAQKVREILDQR